MRTHTAVRSLAAVFLLLLTAAAMPSSAAARAPGAGWMGPAQVQTVSAPQGTAHGDLTTTLTGVTFAGPAYAWACGLHSTLLRSTDGGATWSTLSSPLPDEEVSDVEFVSPTTGWAIGVNNAILRTTNGGGSWSSQVSQGLVYSPYLLALAAGDATHAWIGGYSKPDSSSYINVVLRNDGSSWLPCANLIAAGAAMGWGVTGIDFPDLEHGWAAVSDGEYMFSNDGGVTWTPPIDVLGASFFDDVSFADATHGWIVGQDSSYDGFIMHTADGKTWQRQADSVTLPEVRAVFAVSPSVAWAACADGYVMKTEDAGETWAYDQAVPGVDLNGVACPSADVAVVVGDGGTIIRYGDPYAPPKPVLSGLKPASGYVRSVVTLSGHSFGALRDARCSVTFGAKKATVKSWSDTRIKVTVPRGVARGYVKVKVTTAGGVSGTKKFLRK
jgi:photosystem II stability/assembly factor-like uncharacterized protein